MTFREFLAAHRADLGRIGDLAHDVLRDPELARVKLTPERVRARLTEVGACTGAHESLDLAVEFWSAEWLRCPVCLCGWSAGDHDGLRAPGEVCGNLSTQDRPCVGLLMPQSMFDRAEWVYPEEYGEPDPRRKAVVR